jgi:tetraacyldisaccharide 4'-kinase
MLLPGSRPRAYDDISLLLEATELLDRKISCSYIMVLAPTIDRNRLLSSVSCEHGGDVAVVSGVRIRLFDGPLARAAYGADLLIGLGGTANQVSAGLGVPVVSILERGKLIQKKLLQDAEILVDPTPEALAEASAALLSDPVRRNEMTQAGIRLMGGPGALDAVVEYASKELGWDLRLKLYETLLAAHAPEKLNDPEAREDGEKIAEPSGEVEESWTISEKLRVKLARRLKKTRRVLPSK